MNVDEKALNVAKAMYGIATYPHAGGETQALAKMQIALAQLIDSYEMRSFPAGYRPQTEPLRVQILNDAARLTAGERDDEYGPPAINLAASGELKALFRKHLVRAMSAAELEAIDMALTKLGRIATGKKPKLDTYIDAAAYLAIAGEMALGE